MASKKKQKLVKTYAFIDASNIIYGARAEGWYIDQEKLFKYLKKKFGVSKTFFYYGKDSNNPKKVKFLKKLEKFGYTLRVKEIKRYGNKSKANCDVDLTMDVLIMLNEYKRAIFMTGDGDFAPLLSYIVSKRRKVIIISSPKITAKELKVIAGDEHLDFESLRYLIELKKHKK